VVTKRYTFEENSYRIGIEVSSPSLDGKNISMGWHCGITESEYLKGNSAQNSIAYVNEQRKVHVYGGKSIEHIQIKKPEDKIDPKTGFYKWCALTSKYFVVALVADTLRSADVTIEGYDSRLLDDVKAEAKKGRIVDYSVSMRRTAEGTKEAYWLYAGPGKLSLLQSYKIGLEKVLFGGWELFLRADIWFPYICEFLLWLLVYVNNLVHDYGFTIIILTLITRIITYPLSQSSMKSMNRMKLLQPKINHIRERYKSNPKKMNEEIMAMYREEGINPLNPGCLPMFLQMPILIALYVVLQKAIELRGAHTMMIPWVKDLSQPEMLVPIKNIPVISGMFPNGIPMYGYGIALLPIAMALLTFVQNKMTIKDPNQKAMIYFMPIFMLVLFNNLPAGLVFYWTVSNALGILQQYILNKSMEKEAAVYKANEEKNQRTPKKSGR
jgi:YidC/Oxa1 family membrane protein insertase